MYSCARDTLVVVGRFLLLKTGKIRTSLPVFKHSFLFSHGVPVRRYTAVNSGTC